MIRVLPAMTGMNRPDASLAGTVSARERLVRLVDEELDFVWRSLRRLGVPEAAVDDAAQQVWLVVAKKLAHIAPDRERALLFGTSIRVASDVRRALARRREIHEPAYAELVDPDPRADELVGRAQERV